MATRLANREQYAALSGLVQAWNRRWRLRQVVVWLPFSLIPGVVLGILMLIISRARPWLLKNEILPLTLVLMSAGVLVMLGIIWYWPRSQVTSAQRFDLLFDLKERVSTALELIDGRIRARDDLVEHQLADALEMARAVPYQKAMPFVWRWYGWGALALLLLAFMILLALPNPQAKTVQQASAQNAVIDEAAEDLKDLTEEIATNTALDEAQRESLLQTLETSTETLQEDEISPEEAFATLSETETQLTDEANKLQENINTEQAALDEATETLDQLAQDIQPSEAAQSDMTFSEALDELAQNLTNQSTTDNEATAEALREAAESLAETNPELSDMLEQAAESLQNGDTEAAQQQLEEAAQQAAQDAQTQAQQEQAAQMLQEAAQQTGEHAQQLAQMNQEEGQMPGDQGSQSNQGEQNNPSDEGNEGEVQENTDPSAPGGQLSQMSQSASPNDAESGDSSAPVGSSVSGAGDSDAPASDTASNAQSTGEEIRQDNSPDGQGVSEYEAIFAPRRLGIAGDDTITLETDPSDEIVREADLSDNPTGDTTVPYNQVFSDYQNSVNAALDSGYIPLGLRDVVHDYFTSLDPQR